MNPVRSLARVLLLSMFISGGVDALLHPEPKVPGASDVAEKAASMFGGLILAALDTEGRPGLAWRTGHAIDHAEAAVRRTRREARLAAKAAAGNARAKLAA